MIVRHGFDDVLRVVKYAFNRDIENIFVLQAVHLRGLKTAHFAFRREHEYLHVFLATHGIFRCAAGIARSRTQNIQMLPATRQNVFKQIAEQLHRHVFERQRRAIGQFEQRQRGLFLLAQLFQRCDVLNPLPRTRIDEHLRRIGFRHQRC